MKPVTEGVGTATPGVSGQRVRKPLKKKGLSFGACQRVRKSVKRKGIVRKRSKNIKRKREKTHRLRTGAGMRSRIDDI